MVPALILFFVFAQIGAVDALVFHFGRHQLHAHAHTRPEHWVHTAMSAGFLGVVWGMAFFRPTGSAWWALAGWQALTLLLTLVDVSMEPRSRRPFGGLSATEYFIHMVMNTLHGAAGSPGGLRPGPSASSPRRLAARRLSGHGHGRCCES